MKASPTSAGFKGIYTTKLGVEQQKKSEPEAQQHSDSLNSQPFPAHTRPSLTVAVLSHVSGHKAANINTALKKGLPPTAEVLEQGQRAW